MLVPILMVILALIAAVAIGLITAKRHVFDDVEEPDLRPDDPPPPPGPRGLQERPEIHAN